MAFFLVCLYIHCKYHSGASAVGIKTTVMQFDKPIKHKLFPVDRRCPK